jgi:hypothetical protein
VCEGWSEHTFVWKIDVSGNINGEPMYIHFDFDHWKPWLMERDLNQGVFILTKMVPPGKFYYFFSAGGVHFKAAVANDHAYVKRAKQKFIKRVVCTEIEGDEKKEVTYEMNFIMFRLNYIVQKLNQVMDPKDWMPDPQLKSRPRTIKPYERPLRPRTPWSFPISVFKDYIWDTDDLLRQCFEKDWSMMRFPKMNETESEEVKDELWKLYKELKQIYKFVAPQGSSSTVFSIQMNNYSDIMKNCGIVDGKIINFSTIDTCFLSIVKNSKAGPFNPGNALVRY